MHKGLYAGLTVGLAMGWVGSDLTSLICGGVGSCWDHKLMGRVG